MWLCAGALVSAAWPGGGGWALASAGLVAVAVACRPGGAGAGVLLAAAWGLLGLGLGQTALYRVAVDDVRLVLGERAELVSLEVVLEQGPRWSTAPAAPVGWARPGQPEVAASWLGRVVRANGMPASGRVRVRAEGPAAAVRWRSGDRVSVVGRWATALGPSNPGQTDLAWAERVRGVRGTVSVRGGGATPGAGAQPAALSGEAPLTAVLGWWRSAAAARLADGFGPSFTHEAKVLSALLLGEMDASLTPLFERFQRLGAAHHLVVSGTHLAVVGGFVWLVLRAASVWSLGRWLTPRSTLVMALLCVSAYGLAVSPGDAVTRSVLLSLLAGAALLWARTVNVLNLLGLCAVVMVWVWPPAVFKAGFQLTFAVVWALVAAAPALAGSLRLWRDRDVAVADGWLLAGASGSAGGGAGGGAGSTDGGDDGGEAAAGRKRVWAARLRRWAWGPGLTGASAALVAWWMSVPILAFHVGQVALWGAVASVLLTPVVFAAVVIAALKLVLSAVCPPLSGVWAWGGVGAAWALERSADALAWALGTADGVPTAGRVSAWTAAGLCVLLAAAARWGMPPPATAARGDRPAEGRQVRTRLRCTAVWVAVAGGVLTVPLAGGWRTEALDGVRLTLLSVGAAQCAVLEHGDGTASVFDAGAGGGSNVVRDVLEPLFREVGVRRVRRLVLSHGDADHAGGAATLLRRWPTGELVVGESLVARAQGERARGVTGVSSAAFAAAEATGTPVRVACRGDTWRDGELAVDVLWPGAGAWEGLSDNDASLVLRLHYAGRVVLLCSDVEHVGQAALLAEPGSVRCDVLVLPHHGTHEPTLLPLVRSSEAGVVLVSDDRTPTRGQRKALGELDGGPWRLLRTSEVGAVRVKLGRDGRLDVDSGRSWAR